jgi:hypothetical protein
MSVRSDRERALAPQLAAAAQQRLDAAIDAAVAALGPSATYAAVFAALGDYLAVDEDADA